MQRQLNFNKGILATVGLLFTAMTYGTPGPYVGAGIIGSFDDYNYTVTNVVTGATFHSSPNENEILGNVFLGYGYLFPNAFYVAGELGTNFPRRSFSLTRQGVAVVNETFTNHLHIQDYITGDLLPGYQINSLFLVYGRVGFTNGELSINQPGTITPGTAFNPSHNVWGGRFGAGIRYDLTNHFGVGGDYIYTTYQHLNSTLVAFHTNFNLRVHSNFVGLSVFYNFV